MLRTWKPDFNCMSVPLDKSARFRVNTDLGRLDACWHEFKDEAQCQSYNGQMAYFYEIHAVTGGGYFEGQKNRFLAQKAACQ
jgi:hypothetical protein